MVGESSEILGYHSNELLSVNTLRELKLRSRSRMSKQSFVSVRHVYFLSTDNIFAWICKVQPSIYHRVLLEL
jgi:hypothetical protein